MKSVVICGSQSFKTEIEKFAKRLRKLGVPVVFEPNFERQRKKMLKKKEKDRLLSESYRTRVPGMVFAHLNRIAKSNVCFLYNKGGYSGNNTTLELGFAQGKDLIIYALEPEKPPEQGGEICRDILITEIINTPEELMKRLV
ncbi:MAG: hypothetical protein A2736_02835 [Candidatus Yanofskybacteria bacterium RIFCSPHIGHO2_01_FULL_41_27]|uniref:Uncharacterized protein n=4 Tax=Parcubacteria group TaxID=1794811 RepID=A0A1F8HTG4_9BACT|nr:MAG: hypothetical protein UU83_C0033G0010 [Candidatus Jorgensenbacteria bacterium GW2011_GWF2_41_8]KKS25568.1 MAG: hypothetical protein UU84_C0040G0009 [Candidatus Yanofskybacteria bacterium GW2011_GWC2_41_9]OGM99768.1 MAG: hypothetical protein A2736_02835 [Candidatus Yanofskybacteria bacterium RIFCSPHIGHO2_01_FULL_41_27]OGN19592.1 MAG: hypothetical protein A3B00_01625 [Candidatus Yanofskybacteria bacterium RIFCSPLOWO2_01_FULL_41_33]OGN40885.1 MAG: hypothetical protein A2606_02775 [Candidatu